MDIIYVNEKIVINWTICRNASEVLEDFTKADLRVFLIGNDFDGNYDGKYYFGNELDAEGRVVTTIEAGSLTPGTYCIEALWIKNRHELDKFSTRTLSRARKDRIFKVVEAPEDFSDSSSYYESSSYDENPNPAIHEINIKTGVTSYGYDGMSAYETAVFEYSTKLSEQEWIERYQQAEDRINYEMEEDTPGTWANAELLRKRAEGQLGSSDEGWSTSREHQEDVRQANEAIRQANEETRQEQEGSPTDAASSTGSRWARYKQAEIDRNTSYASEEGSAAGSTTTSNDRWGKYKAAEAGRDSEYASAEGTASASAGDANRWGSYKTAENTRDAARLTAEGTIDSESGASNRWGQYKAQEGTPASTEDDSRWAEYNSAEDDRDTAYATAEGAATDAASATGSRWARYNKAEADRNAAYAEEEGSLAGSSAGDSDRWGQFKSAEADRNDAMAPLVGYFGCATAASTAAKEVSASDYVLTSGGSIKVKFTYANSASSPTLNINSTGAKAIVYNGAVASATNTWAAGDVVEFYYDPTYNSNAGAFVGIPTVVSVSQNTLTKHSDIIIGNNTYPVASLENIGKIGEEIFEINKKFYDGNVTLGQSVSLNSSISNYNLNSSGGKEWVGASGAIHLYQVLGGQDYQINSDMQGNNPSMCLFADINCDELISIVYVGNGQKTIRFRPVVDCYLGYSYWDGLSVPETLNEITFNKFITDNIKDDIFVRTDIPSIIQPTEIYQGKFIDPDYHYLRDNESFDVIEYSVASYPQGIINIPYTYAKGASYLGYMFKNQNGTVIEFGNYVGKETFEIPLDASTFWFSANANTNNPNIEIYAVAPINEVVDRIREGLSPITAGVFKGYADSLTSNQSINLQDVPDLSNNYLLNFYANIESMGRIRLQHGSAAYSIGAIEVDDTNVYCYDNSNGTTLVKTVAHNVTISKFVFIQVEFKNSYPDLMVRISSDGDAFVELDIHNAYWNGGNGTTLAKVISGTFTNANFSFGGNAWLRPTWIFVDSYGDYWPPYLVAIGMKNFLRDGYSGRNSTQALTSLKLELKLQSPKVLLWCMGMNDEDGTSTINQNYKNVLDEIISICINKKIKLVVTTIPNTPTRKHTYKNAYIKSIGVDYIDVAKAVGADSAGSSWTTGYLSSDNVHPTAKGARVIAQAIITGMPCLMDM